jgi:hypothetical protein
MRVTLDALGDSDDPAVDTRTYTSYAGPVYVNGREDDGEGSVGGGRTFFTELKTDPGALGLESLLGKVNKLQRVRKLELPPELFGDVSEKWVSAWRARAAKEYPSDLIAAAGPVRCTLLATLCHSPVDLFIQLVQKINTKAEKKVEGEFVKELKKVRGKEGILLQLAEAAVAEPNGTVRRVIYPVAGDSTLKALAAEAASNEARHKARIRTVLRSSYSNHWRRMLSPLLSVLELKCNNTPYRPVMDAIELLKRYLDQPVAKEGAFFDEAERIPYELCVLVSLRDALRRREIWVAGASRWRNPEDDLPKDFEVNRDRRALSPLLWTNVNPYGLFELDMSNRRDLYPAAVIPGQRADPRQTAPSRESTGQW